MKFIRLLFLCLLITGLSGCDGDDDVVTPVTRFNALFADLNNSGVSGEALLTLEGNNLTVSIEAQGLVPNQLHPQHIHGLDNATQTATCPPATADQDGNGIISVPEGAPFYGGILLPLENFPTADVNGEISYLNTFVLGQNGNPTLQELGNLENRIIILHGLNDNEGEYVATIPVACGPLIRE